MNILHLLSQNHLTGAEVYAVSLIEKQIQKKHTVFQVSNGFFCETLAKKIELAVETKSTFEFWSSVLSLRKILIEKNIQVIHAHSRAASKLANIARLGLKIGYISTVHGRQHVSISKKINNIYGDFIVPVCFNIQDQLISEFKYNQRRIKIIENGIDTSRFKFQNCKKNTDVFKIAIIGRDTGPKKYRTEIFVSEFSKILDSRNLKYQFHIVGGRSANFKLQANSSIHFIEAAFLDSDFYHKFDLICGSGRVCIEAMLSGVPVIAFGEHKYEGLVTSENYDQLKSTNFGDIGLNFDLPVFNSIQAARDTNNLSAINLEELSKKTKTEFDIEIVSQKIQRVYESSYFLRHYSKWIPILMYHKIPNQNLNSKHKIYVSIENFKKHLSFFKFLGFQTLTFSELSDYRCGRTDFKKFPKKPLLLTFDDGYIDNIENADPALKANDMKAQIFLLADPQLNSNTWDQLTDTNSVNAHDEAHPIISGTNREKWLTSNFEIGSHGLKHQKMPAMNFSKKIFELTESKFKLETEFKVPMKVFAYTYGDTNADCAKACEASGYEYGLNTDTGGLLLEEDPYSIFRVNIFPDETVFSLWKKTASWYRKYYYFKRRR